MSDIDLKKVVIGREYAYTMTDRGLELLGRADYFIKLQEKDKITEKLNK